VLPLAHRSMTCAKLRRHSLEANPHAQHLSDCQPVRRLLLSPDFIGHGGADQPRCCVCTWHHTRRVVCVVRPLVTVGIAQTIVVTDHMAAGILASLVPFAFIAVELFVQKELKKSPSPAA